MTAAFAYLIGRTFRIAFVSQARRIRSPRYAFAFLFGLAFRFVISPRGAGAQINPLYGISGGARTALRLLFTRPGGC
jgi:hypothetical protein